MKFPINEQWIVDPSTDKGLSIYGVRNISFEQKKYATLAPKNLRIFDTDDDADFEAVVSFYNDDANGKVAKMFGTDDEPYNIDLESHVSISKDTNGDEPNGDLDSSGVMFNGEWVVTESSNIHTNDGSTWTDRTISGLDGAVRHPLANFKNRNNLAVGDGDQVKLYNSSYSLVETLQLPGGLEVTGLAYNRNLLAIVCASTPNDGYIFIWDGATSQANFGYPLNSQRAMWVAPYLGTFLTLTGAGEGLVWNGGGMEQLFAFPAFFKSYGFAEMRASNRTIAHDTAYYIEKGRIYMNVEVLNEDANEEPSRYEPIQPSGVWVFDPKVGLYHRNATTAAKIIESSCTNANVNLTTDTITVSGGANVPDTGTPVVQVNSNNEITPISARKTYYTIQVSSTEFQLALSHTDALAGTQIDLTAVETGSYDFTFLPNGDFGQFRSDGVGFAIAATGSRDATSLETALFTNIVYSVENNPGYTLSDDDSLCVACPFGENRGTIVTQKLFSPDVTSSWQKVITKVRCQKNDRDKVLLKARVSEDVNMPVFSDTGESSTTNAATWVDATSFTTTADLTYVKQALDAGLEYEVDFIAGAASGYTAHITTLSESSGTWTVTIDETIENISASDRAHFVIDNWVKVRTVQDVDSPDEDADKNQVEFVFGDMFTASKWLQLKFELRGNKIAIEEYELIIDGQDIAS